MAKRPVFRDTWKDYFSFSRRERRGILALLSIVFLQISFLIWLNYFPSKKPEEDFSAFEKLADAFYASDTLHDSLQQASNDLTDGKEERARDDVKKKAELFSFNPNNLSVNEWQRLGFSDKQINVIKNYESKGGKFYSKETMKKMYCISEEQYNRIEPYINIPEKSTEHHYDTIKKYERKTVLVDIGIADTVELTNLRGIGPSFARRISVYRNKLGGFIHREQLREVWGFTDSLYLAVVPNISLNDSSNIKKINLNSADFNELRNHPYIGYQLAGLISNFRQQHKSFSSVEEIKKIPLVNDQLYSKLAPYLKVE